MIFAVQCPSETRYPILDLAIRWFVLLHSKHACRFSGGAWKEMEKQQKNVPISLRQDIGGGGFWFRLASPLWPARHGWTLVGIARRISETRNTSRWPLDSGRTYRIQGQYMDNHIGYLYIQSELYWNIAHEFYRLLVNTKISSFWAIFGKFGSVHGIISDSQTKNRRKIKIFKIGSIGFFKIKMTNHKPN